MLRVRLALLAVAICLTATVPAQADTKVLSAAQALQLAARQPVIQRLARTHPRLAATVKVDEDHYVVRFGPSPQAAPLAEVDIDVLSGKIVRVFTGVKAAYPLARGHDSGFATRKLDALWIWLPLTLIFVGAFFDWRRPLRLLHLDLAAIAALGISWAFFMTGNLDASVPLVYPTLVYVLVRMLIAGFRPTQRPGPVSRLPVRVLIGLTLGLLVLRIGLTLADPFVSDIGYASSAGADRILHGLQLYTRGGAHLDTYGPLGYLLYIPFVLIWPFNPVENFPPSAQAAAIVWELATLAGLVVLGRRLRPGTPLGWALALAWAACPFTALALATATNDALVAALLVWAFVAFQSPLLRGVLGGAAAAAKIAPAFALPVLARGTGRLDWKRGAICLAAAAVVILGALIPLLPPGGLSEFYDATIAFQLHRESPFSIWYQHPSWDWLQTLLKLGSVALALSVVLVPRGTRTLAQVAALTAAVLVAAEIPLEHWFYLYLPWFVPLYCLALFSEHGAGERPAASQP